MALLSAVTSRMVFTQCHSVAKNVGCFRQHLFVCQHDNFRTSKHRVMKLGGKRIAQKCRQSSNLGVIAPRGVQPPKCGILLSHDALLQNVNKPMWSDETSHRTHRAHRTCVRQQCWGKLAQPV